LVTTVVLFCIPDEPDLQPMTMVAFESPIDDGNDVDDGDMTGTHVALPQAPAAAHGRRMFTHHHFGDRAAHRKRIDARDSNSPRGPPAVQYVKLQWSEVVLLPLHQSFPAPDCLVRLGQKYRAQLVPSVSSLTSSQ